MTRLIRRIRWAWRLKTLPWNVPSSMVTYLALRFEVTPVARQHAAELAERSGRTDG